MQQLGEGRCVLARNYVNLNLKKMLWKNLNVYNENDKSENDVIGAFRNIFRDFEYVSTLIF